MSKFILLVFMMVGSFGWATPQIATRIEEIVPGSVLMTIVHSPGGEATPSHTFKNFFPIIGIEGNKLKYLARYYGQPNPTIESIDFKDARVFLPSPETAKFDRVLAYPFGDINDNGDTLELHKVHSIIAPFDNPKSYVAITTTGLKLYLDRLDVTSRSGEPTIALYPNETPSEALQRYYNIEDSKLDKLDLLRLNQYKEKNSKRLIKDHCKNALE